MREHAALGRDYALVLVGRKAEGYFRYRNFRIDSVFSGFSDQPTYENARSIARAVEAPFLSGEYDLVELIYTRFVSAGRQEIVVRPMMPLDLEILEGGDARPAAHSEGEVAAGYEFEPEPEEILHRLLPVYAEARLYAALLNAAASEHAARQRAMKAATDNADDLIISLTRVMNRARQDAITSEIMEIVGGAEALRKDKHTSHSDDSFYEDTEHQPGAAA
jgi:F-type H+-transporting ATPase subunit gamma